VATRQYLDADEHVQQEKTRTMKSRGPARESLDPPIVQQVDGPVSKDKLEALRFNEEVLTVMVHDTTNPSEEPIPEVWNDGIVQRFIRGREQQVKRKYVEILARAKRTTRGNEKYKDLNGDDAYRYPAHTALRYPFSVINDPNPKGRDWLRGILAQA
jgi:hypothetical protein